MYEGSKFEIAFHIMSQAYPSVSNGRNCNHRLRIVETMYYECRISQGAIT